MIRLSVGRGAVQLPLEALDGVRHLILALAQPLDVLRALLSVRRKIPDVVLHLTLLAGQLVHPVEGTLGIASGPVCPGVLQAPLGFLQAIEGRARLRSAGVARLGGRAPHGLGGLLETAGGLLHPCVVVLPRQTLELPCGGLGRVGQIALGLPATRGRSSLPGATSLPFGLLLLAAGQLLQPLQELVRLIVGLLALAALDRLVLVLELVQLQLEQVRQVFRGGLLSAAASGLLPPLPLLLDVDLVGLLRLLQEAEGLLLGGERALEVLLVQGVVCTLHRVGRLRQDRRHVPEARIHAREAPGLHSLQKRLDLLLQTSLGQGDAHDVLAELVVRVAVSFTLEVEGGRDDLALELGQGRVIGALLPASLAAALLLRLLEGLLERADVQEVDVAGDRPRGPERSIVPRQRVVGHQVTGLQPELLEEEGVPDRRFRHRGPSGLEQRHGVLGPAVHRVDQPDVPDPVVVVRPDLQVDLLDR